MKKPRQLANWSVLSLLATLVFSAVTQAQSSDVAPIFEIRPLTSKITFYVEASGHLVTSTDASTGVLDIKIQADSVETGSKSKDKRLKGEQCFDVEKHPYITFHSTSITQTGANSFDVSGTFTLRGVSKPESLTFSVDRQGGGVTGEIRGALVFNSQRFSS